MASIVPSERLRRELHDLVAGVGDEHDPIEAIGRFGARLILQQALEEELSEFLGRERYERRGEPVAHRNGYEPVTVKTTAGPLELERPRVRNASALGFASEIVGKGVARTQALEEAFDGPVVSKSTVSRICASTQSSRLTWCNALARRTRFRLVGGSAPPLARSRARPRRRGRARAIRLRGSGGRRAIRRSARSAARLRVGSPPGRWRSEEH